MGIFDKAKDLVGDHNAEVDQAIDKTAEMADEKTGGQYTEQIDRARNRSRRNSTRARHSRRPRAD